MAEKTGIEWTHHTWSPWWGCTKVSDGCKNCYADTLSNRFGFKIWGPNADRRFFGEKHWNDPLRWNKAAEKARGGAGERRRVFPSMCDPFEDRPDLVEPRRRMFELIDKTPWLDWLLLTKRPENIYAMWPEERRYRANTWLLTSVEDQASADKRVPELLDCWGLAHVLGLSIEPLLSGIHLRSGIYMGRDARQFGTSLTGINWVIVGGESGPHARPMHPDWARSIRDECEAAGVNFFFKQWGNWMPDSNGSHFVCAGGDFDVYNDDRIAKHDDGDCCGLPIERISNIGKHAAGRLLDGRTWDEFPTMESTVKS